MEYMQTAITCIETAKASTNLGYEEAERLNAILQNLKDSVSLTSQLHLLLFNKVNFADKVTLGDCLAKLKLKG